MVYVSETKEQYLLTERHDILDSSEEAILMAGDMNVKTFLPVKKIHNFIKLDETTYELDVEPIEAGTL